MDKVYVTATYESKPPETALVYLTGTHENSYSGSLAKKNPVSAYMARIGKNGGAARAKALTAAERSDSARRAAQARWAKKAGGATK